MNSELLFESIGYLDDELIERSEESANVGRRLWLSWSVAAACVVLLAGGAVYSGLNVTPLRPKDATEFQMDSLSPSSDSWEEADMFIQPADSMEQEQMYADQELEADSNTQRESLSADMLQDGETEDAHLMSAAKQKIFAEAEAEPFVSIEDLTVKERGKEDKVIEAAAGVEEQVMVKQMSQGFMRCTLELGTDTAYTMLYTFSDIDEKLSEDVLKASLGGSLAEYMKYENSGMADAPDYEFYRVSGHKELQYVILYEPGRDHYSLLKFDCLQGEDYAYRNILEMVYGIYSADDIARIVSHPSEMDNTDAGKAQKQAIGELEITDRADILAFYNVLSAMTCYGPDRWDKVQNSKGDSPNATLESARLERYLTIETVQGNQIDTMRYTALGGMFYESGGIAYSALSEADAAKMAEILHIN